MTILEEVIQHNRKFFVGQKLIKLNNEIVKKNECSNKSSKPVISDLSKNFDVIRMLFEEFAWKKLNYKFRIVCFSYFCIQQILYCYQL